jgi:hypothetical protein
MKTKFARELKGGGVLMVMVILLALGVAIAGVTSYVNTVAKTETRAEAEVKASRAAEAAIEENVAKLYALAKKIRPSVPQLSQVTTACNLSTVPSSIFPASAGYNYTTNIAVPIESGVAVNSFTALSDATLTYRYLSAADLTYSMPGMSPVRVAIQREFIHEVKPLFQYAIFFDGDLEIFPGPAFTVEGRVHSNNTIYYGSDNPLTFQGFVTYGVAASKNFAALDSNHGGGTAAGTNVVFANGVTPGRQPYKIDKIKFPCSDVSASVNQSGPHEFIQMPVVGSGVTDPDADERLFNKAGLKILVNTDTTGTSYTAPNGEVIPARTRTGSPLKPYTSPCPVANQVAGGWDPGFRLYTMDGTMIPLRNSSSPAAWNDLYKLFDNPIATGGDLGPTNQILMIYNKSVVDYRQGSTAMRVTDVDVSKLGYAVDSGVAVNTGSTPATVTVRLGTIVPDVADYGSARGKALWNGIVYIHDVSYDGAAAAAGVHLVNGNYLPSTVVPASSANGGGAPGGGLSIVTDHPLYIEGDYNTGAGDQTVGGYTGPTVNTGATTAAATATGYTVRPAAVMADAVTILSRKWTPSNYNGAASYSSRGAIATTVNAAILAGNVPTGTPASETGSITATYSGGAENFPRLLETWAGIRLTIYGSMICLYPSTQAKMPWRGTSGYYDAATRNWHFEPTFRNPNKLPPGTPAAVIFSHGEWVRLK